MSRDYDAVIAEHYRKVAEEDGLSWSSTMADEITRRMETESIESFLRTAVRTAADDSGRAAIADIGCGNGYTLGVMAGRFPEHDFVGIEMSDDLRRLAQERVTQDGIANATVRAGDIRESGFAEAGGYHVALCQRVLINLLNEADQRAALSHIVDTVRPGGALLFIEAFQSGLDRLNEARAEFGLDAIPPAHHNLYLPDGFFDGAGLQPFEHLDWLTPPNLLSTHYYVSRVLLPLLLGGKPFKRNSHFVRFFAQALPPAIGDYSQLRILAFRKP